MIEYNRLPDFHTIMTEGEYEECYTVLQFVKEFWGRKYETVWVKQYSTETEELPCFWEMT